MAYPTIDEINNMYLFGQPLSRPFPELREYTGSMRAIAGGLSAQPKPRTRRVA